MNLRSNFFLSKTPQKYKKIAAIRKKNLFLQFISSVDL